MILQIHKEIKMGKTLNNKWKLQPILTMPTIKLRNSKQWEWVGEIFKMMIRARAVLKVDKWAQKTKKLKPWPISKDEILLEVLVEETKV